MGQQSKWDFLLQHWERSTEPYLAAHQENPPFFKADVDEECYVFYHNGGVYRFMVDDNYNFEFLPHGEKKPLTIPGSSSFETLVWLVENHGRLRQNKENHLLKIQNSCHWKD